MIDNLQVPSPEGIIVDLKILYAFERTSQVLKAMAWSAAKRHNLNPAQAQVLTFLAAHGERDNHLTSLAKEFNTSKASLSDTLASLEKKQLVLKMQSLRSNRSVQISLTPQGRHLAVDLARYNNVFSTALSKITDQKKEILFEVMGELLFELRTSRFIQVQRMCLTCSYHQMHDGLHFCSLLGKHLTKAELRLDCNEHVQTNENL